jgi:hypothetical protein
MNPVQMESLFGAKKDCQPFTGRVYFARFNSQLLKPVGLPNLLGARIAAGTLLAWHPTHSGLNSRWLIASFESAEPHCR